MMRSSSGRDASNSARVFGLLELLIGIEVTRLILLDSSRFLINPRKGVSYVKEREKRARDIRTPT